MPATSEASGGSSPRMRGTRDWFTWLWQEIGLIPAHAGNTRVDLRLYLPPGAHPRACGEHETSGLDKLQAEGSSPRMRGTPFFR